MDKISSQLFAAGALFSWLTSFHILWTVPDFSVQNYIIQCTLFASMVVLYASSGIAKILETKIADK